MSGWGLGQWGLSPWGSGSDAPRLLSAVAVRENAVLLTFDGALLYTGTLGPKDAARTGAYALSPVAGTADQHGDPARAVLVGRVDPAGLAGAAVLLWLDRALSGFPARYLAAAPGVYGAGGLPVDSSAQSATFYGVRAERPVLATPEALAVGRDLANLQTPGALAEARAQGLTLGSYVADATGDYAFDAGETSYLKRVYRRLLARPGAFKHLPPDYGLGLLARSKRLATGQQRAELARDAAEQVRREPETAEASAQLVLVGPNAYELRVKARTRFSPRELGFSVPLGA